MQNARTITIVFVPFELCPFELCKVSKTKSCPLCNFKTVQGIFMKLHTNINQQ